MANWQLTSKITPSNKMENRRSYRYSLIILLLQLTIILFLSLCPGKSHARTNEAEALVRLYREKLFNNSSGIDRSNSFNVVNQELFVGSGDSAAINRVYPQQNLKEKDKILRLPGQPRVDFDQYGGYVTVDASKGRAFFYYFVEAPKAKESLPILLWLNGGPGCSSLAYGAMQELGPFRVKSDGKTLFRNRYAWNNVANVLFLESPAGVGFSYSNTTSESKTNGDRTTAADNYWFLRNWLQRFPEYKNRDFYISGESYAGHYVPQLAHFILSMNKRVDKNIINLKGIIMGNAVINDATDYPGMYDYLWTHALISDELHEEIAKTCDFTPNAPNLAPCYQAEKLADYQTYYVLDLYNIYYPLCHSKSAVTAKPKKASVNHFDPCSDNYVHWYLNTPEVQKALHANVTKLDYDWESCANITWTDAPSTVVPLLREFMANGLRVWLFSGDTDGVVPVTSTRYSIDSMNMTTKAAWSPWFNDGEVGGYTQVYKGDLTFATVRGAGHQVPSYQAKRSLSLITHFLSGSPLSTHKP